jgi:hypothetical protein
MNAPRYDIFSGYIDRNAIWLESVEGLGDASDRMLELATGKPGPYFVFCLTTHKILASVDTSVIVRKSVENEANGQQFIHTLVFECPECHLPAVIGRLSPHGNREALHNEAQNIECPFCKALSRMAVAAAREHYIAVWKENEIRLLRKSSHF